MKTLLIKLAYTNYCWGSSEDEGLSDTNLSYKQKKITLPMFQLNAAVVIGVKVATGAISRNVSKVIFRTGDR